MKRLRENYYGMYDENPKHHVTERDFFGITVKQMRELISCMDDDDRFTIIYNPPADGLHNVGHYAIMDAYVPEDCPLHTVLLLTGYMHNDC